MCKEKYKNRKNSALLICTINIIIIVWQSYGKERDICKTHYMSYNYKIHIQCLSIFLANEVVSGVSQIKCRSKTIFSQECVITGVELLIYALISNVSV